MASGRLINRDKLARAKEQRAVRKRRILEEAGSTFMRMAYSEVTLDTIGQRADVERGVASMFFGSKEELFLIVFKELLEEWFGYLERRLSADDEISEPERLALLLARSVAKRPALTKFLSLLPVVLEQDLEAMVVYRFQRWRCDRMTALGALMERAASYLGEGGGFGLLYRVQLVAAGLEMAANPRGAAAFERETPEFVGLWVDMENELADVIAGYLDAARDVG
jgi:AcrR family transcriptional regulator